MVVSGVVGNRGGRPTSSHLPFGPLDYLAMWLYYYHEATFLLADELEAEILVKAARFALADVVALMILSLVQEQGQLNVCKFLVK